MVARSAAENAERKRCESEAIRKQLIQDRNDIEKELRELKAAIAQGAQRGDLGNVRLNEKEHKAAAFAR